MNYKKILSRLNGLSIGPVGASWEAKPPEADTAQRVINFFDDRRVLYNPFELEIPEYCVQSIHEMRRFLTDTLDSMPNADGLPENLRAMRAACRRFLDTVEKGGRRVIIHSFHEGGRDAITFFSALGELRATIGLHLSILAARYHLNITGDLTKILPPAEEPDA